MEVMCYSNRELVEFFVGFKLRQRNYPVSLLRPQDPGQRTETEDQADSAASNGLLDKCRNRRGQPEMMPPPSSSSSSPPAAARNGGDGGLEAIKAALRDSAEEFELLFKQAFSDLSLKLDITPDTAYHSFKCVMDEVFKDGVNWGRIVGLFVFGGILSVECVEKDMSELVSRIVDWMTMYLDQHISPWIQTQGGWDSFAEVFGRGSVAEARRCRETLRSWLLLVGAGLLSAVVIGILVSKRQ